MIKVIYKIQVMYEGRIYVFNMAGTLVALPRKGELVEINERLTFKVKNVLYIDNKKDVQINFTLIKVTEEKYLNIKNWAFYKRHGERKND